MGSSGQKAAQAAFYERMYDDIDWQVYRGG